MDTKPLRTADANVLRPYLRTLINVFVDISSKEIFIRSWRILSIIASI